MPPAAKADRHLIPAFGYGKKLLVIIDHPTVRSWKDGVHLMGREKVLIESALRSVGYSNMDTHYTYAVPRMYEKYGTDVLSEWVYWLDEVITKVQPEKILALGAFAHTMLKTPGNKIASIKEVRGMMHDFKGIPFLSTVAPWQGFSEPYWFRDLFFDIEKISRQDKRQPEPEIEMIVCNTAAELRNALHKIDKAPIVSVDIESTGLDFNQDSLLAIGLGAALKGNKGRVVIIPRHLIYTQSAADYDDTRLLVKKFLSGKSFAGTLALHNGKFDIKFINRWLREDIYNPQIKDTMLLNYVVDERPLNHLCAPHGLKRVAKDRFDAVDYKIKDFVTYADLEPTAAKWQTLYNYLALDLIYTARLYKVLREQMEAEQPESIFVYDNILCPASSVLAYVEQYGAPANPKKFAELAVQLNLEIEDHISTMKILLQDAGYAKWATFNPRSSKQIAAILFDHFRVPMVEKKRTSKADALDKTIHMHGEKLESKARMFIEHLGNLRKLEKTVSTYAEPLAERGAMGTIYGQYNLAGTSTGRLSSQEPNFQNMPNMAGDDIRRCFEAPAGWVWLKADYSQLELRMAAHLSQDPNMIQAYLDERDLHIEVAIAMFGQATWDAADKETRKAMRFAAKFFDFGIIYGRGAKSLAEGKELRGYGWTLKDAQRFMDNFLGEFSGLRDWMKQAQATSIKEQQLITQTGRYRRWPVITDETLWEYQRQALNFPIQSLASDTTVTAMIRIFEWLRTTDYRARIVATVHDEIDLIVHYEDLDAVAAQIISIMSNAAPVPLLVPLVAEVEIGPNWTDLEKWEAGKMPSFLEVALPL